MFENLKDISDGKIHNQTDIENDSDMIEIKTNEDVFNELKLRNQIEVHEKKLKNNTQQNNNCNPNTKLLNISINSIKSNNSRSLNESETGSVVDMKNEKRYKFDTSSNHNIFTLESLNSVEFKKECAKAESTNSKNKNTNLNDSVSFSAQQEINQLNINVKKSKL